MREAIGHFELLVMLALLRVGNDAYGVPIGKALEEALGREVTLAKVYAALDRLEDKHLVTSWLGKPTAARGGRAKRHFEATALGLREVRRAQLALTTLWRRLPQLREGPA
jgi:PadR family transcriptional regulator, regulatory protein PadR